jgi:hypothetical protein
MAAHRGVRQGPDAAHDLVEALAPPPSSLLVASGHQRIVAFAAAIG